MSDSATGCGRVVGPVSLRRPGRSALRGPWRPGATSNSTCWPSSRLLCPVPTTLEKWTNTSFSPVDGRDEAEAPVVVEELHSSSCHVSVLFLFFVASCSFIDFVSGIGTCVRGELSVRRAARGGLTRLAVHTALIVVAPSEDEVALTHFAGVLVAQRDVGQDHGDGERVVIRIGSPIERPAGWHQ